MEHTWANSLDLHLPPGGSRVRAGVETALREAVRSGRLTAGTRLPTSRALAADLGLARNTVADAYAQLVAEGWLVARTGAGTWVAEHSEPGPTQRVRQGASPPALRYDLRPGVPNLAAFPRRAWLAAVRSVLNEVPDDVLSYPDPRGLPQLRAAVAGYIGRVRGVVTDPDRIVICAGFSHGLALLCQALRATGATHLAVEAYGQPTHRRTVQTSGLEVIPLQVDADGARPDRLGRAGAALLTPAHQFPLGMTLQPHRRREFIEWAVQNSALLIEDDYDGEFRYDRQPIGALQALAPQHVVYAGTASKSLAPGLRLGWLAVPHRLLDPLLAAMQGEGGLCSSIEQLTLARLMQSGAYDRHVRSARLNYRRRRDLLVGGLRQQVPGARVSGIAAGLHLLLELPHGHTEAAAVAHAAERGLAVDGLADYAAKRHDYPPSLVVGYARPADHAYTATLARFSMTLRETNIGRRDRPTHPAG